MTYLYRKEFSSNQYGSLCLKNPETAIEYCERRLEELKAGKPVISDIFSYFKTIVEYDQKNCIFPEPFGEFQTSDDKEEFIRTKILYEDFRIYLGDILLNYHCALAKANELKVIDAIPFVIDFNELYDTALQEYIRVLLRVPHPVQIKSNERAGVEYRAIEHQGKEIKLTTGTVRRQEHACAATFILPSLIEHFLRLYLENTVIDQWLTGCAGKGLTKEERELYNEFLSMKQVGHGILSKDRATALSHIWTMGVKYGAFPDDPQMKQMLCGRNGDKNTLGAMLASSYARSRIRSEYLQILDYMFGKKNLNLRNSIAHGISTTYDYLSLAFVAVMIQIIWDIGDNKVILGYRFE